MPGSFPMGFEVCNAQDIGSVTATTLGTTITSGSTSNTKGAWTQIVAPTTADCCWAVLDMTNIVGTRNFLVDIGVGGSGTEVPVISNVFLPVATTMSKRVSIPLSIPAGSRVSARCQSSNVGSVTCSVRLSLFDGAFTQMEGAAGAEALGPSTATSLASTLTPNATANTKATSYTAFSASTARDYQGLYVTLQGGTVSQTYMIDIAIGAAASEVPILPDILEGNTVTLTTYSRGFYVPIPIPAGSRVSGRCQSSGTSAAAISCEVIGVYA